MAVQTDNFPTMKPITVNKQYDLDSETEKNQRDN
jgi:hypothetical protein